MFKKLISDLSTPKFAENTISSSLAVENVPASYTGEYVVQVTADNKKMESDPLALFVIGKDMFSPS